MKIKVIAEGVPVLGDTFARILQTIPNIDAELVRAESKGFQLDFNTFDVLWNIGFFFEVDNLFDQVKAFYPHIKIVNTWVGSDILNASMFLRQRPKCFKCILRSIDVHVADGPNLQQELKQWFSLNSHYVPSIPDPMPLTPIQDTKKVAVYMPAHRKDFYNYNAIMQTAEKNLGFHFNFFSMFQDPNPPNLSNTHFKGFFLGEDKKKAYAECGYLFTFPEHGSLSLMLIEFMQMGRRVISNIQAPYVYTIGDRANPEEISKQLQKAYEDTIKYGEYKEASEYYHKEYSFEKVREKLQPVIEQLQKIGEYVY